MHSLAVCVLAVLAAGQVRAQRTCVVRNSNVFLLIDTSETARREASTDLTIFRNYTDFGELRRSLRLNFTQHPSLAAVKDDTANMLVGAISYTGFDNETKSQATVTQFPTSLRQFENEALDDVNGNIPDRVLTNNGVDSGGSWTYRGLSLLENLINSGSYPEVQAGENNWVVLISAQGSHKRDKRQQAIDIANRLKTSTGRSFKIFVIGLVEKDLIDNLDVVEMQGVASSPDDFIEISAYGQERPANSIRPTLPEALDTFVRTRLLTCVEADNPCLACKFETGTYIVPDPEGCATYLVCDINLSWTRMDCGPGTLYNDTIKNCVDMNNYYCPAWGQCTRGSPVRRFPAKCCRQYYQCQGGVVTWETCPDGGYFDPVNERCVANTASSFSNYCGSFSNFNRYCPSPDATPDTRPCSERVGLRAVASNPCSYQQWNGATWLTRDCADGSAFSSTSCGCHVRNANCARPQAPQMRSANCLPSVHLTFDNVDVNARQLTAFNDSSNSVARVWVDRKKTVVSNNKARFLGSESQGWIAIPYFNNREWAANFAVTARYRMGDSAALRTLYDIWDNSECKSDCSPPSLSLQSSVESRTVGSVSVRIRFTVIDVAGNTVTMQATVTKQDVNDWVEVKTVIQGERVAGEVTVYNSDLSVTRDTIRMRETATNNLEGTIAGGVAKRQCALGIGRGQQNINLIGEIDDFAYIECDNPMSIIS